MAMQNPNQNQNSGMIYEVGSAVGMVILVLVMVVFPYNYFFASRVIVILDTLYLGLLHFYAFRQGLKLVYVNRFHLLMSLVWFGGAILGFVRLFVLGT